MKQNGYQQQYEEISSAAHIAAILRPLQQQHSILSVALPSAKRLYNSTLLEINTDQGFLLLDELHPSEGHALIGTASRIGLSAHREGVEVKMILDISETGSENGVAFYKVPFPRTIRYRQRRHTFRIAVSAAQTIPVKLADAQGNLFSGELHDISAEGMCIRLPFRMGAPEKENTEPLSYTITLPDKKRISGQFIAHRIHHHEPSRTIQIGGSFDQPDKVQARSIERFVFELQREERRKMSR